MSEPSAWPAIVADLRRALALRRMREAEIDAFLVALQPVAAAVERAGTRIDSEVCWALLGVEADRQRRRARHARMAERGAA